MTDLSSSPKLKPVYRTLHLYSYLRKCMCEKKETRIAGVSSSAAKYRGKKTEEVFVSIENG